MKSHTFRGRRYRIDIHNRLHRNLNGQCDAPTTLGKTIHLRKNIPDKEFLETALDEAIHACLWELDNDIVGDCATDIARFLTRLGYRRETPNG